MQNVIEDLFFGEIRVNGTKSETTCELLGRLEEYDEKLILLLGDEGKKLFITRQSIQMEIDGNEMVEKFVSGFRLGASMAIEVLHTE